MATAENAFNRDRALGKNPFPRKACHGWVKLNFFTTLKFRAMQKWQEVLSQQSRKQSRKRRHIGRVNWSDLGNRVYVQRSLSCSCAKVI